MIKSERRYAMYRPPLSKGFNIKPLLINKPVTELLEFALAWNKGEIIPDNADEASSCFEFAESFYRFKDKILFSGV